jgi:hypothetical protein
MRGAILPLPQYVFMAWCLVKKKHRNNFTLERRLRLSDNRVLRRIFGPKREEVAGDWRRLHNEELHKLYASSDMIRVRVTWVGHVACMDEMRNAHNILVGKPEGKRPLGRIRRKREDNIKMDLRHIWCKCVDWMQLAQDRDQWRAVVNTVMNLRVT